jgi:hypothetical protein
LEDDPLEFGECRAAEAQRGLEPLQAHLASVESTPKLVQQRPLLFQYLTARRVEHDQMPWALKTVRQADVGLAFPSVKSLDGDDHRLISLQPFGDGGATELVRAYLNVTFGHPAGQQRADPRQREHRTALLHDPLREPDRVRSRGAGDYDQTARRVAHSIGRSENAAANRDVHRAGLRTVAPWALR